MQVFFRVCLLLPFVIQSGGAMDRVIAQDGNIVLEDSSGKTTTLTQSRVDSDPWLTPDGRSVVFLRHPAEGIFRNSVYEIDVSTHMVKLLYAGPAKYEGREISSFSRPELDVTRTLSSCLPTSMRPRDL